jgi:AraC-like DNA-binding protein
MIENEDLKDMTVDNLAEHLKVDRTTLFRTFKETFGVSPKKYIDRLRIEKACQLLSMNQLKIKDIAKACGYSNQSYFSQIFEKHFECSPSEWRKNNLRSKI